MTPAASSSVIMRSVLQDPEAGVACCSIDNLSASRHGKPAETCTGSSTVAPMEERAAAALEAREAPTQAQVSSSDRGASKGRSLCTKLGRKVLHTSPANQMLSQVCICQSQA